MPQTAMEWDEETVNTLIKAGQWLMRQGNWREIWAQDREEILQEGWVLLLEWMARRPGEDGRGWLRTKYEYSVKEAAGQRYQERKIFYEGEWRTEAVMPTAPLDTESLWISYEDIRRLEKAMDKMPERTQAILEDWSIGLSFKDIAKVHGVTEGRISQLLKQYAPYHHGARKRASKDTDKPIKKKYAYTVEERQRAKEMWSQIARITNKKRWGAKEETI
jgi:RNA polymerase sigma factor (sigma-70 family)